MQNRGRAKALTSQSLSNPVSPLEGHGSRPLSRASEEEGDLGLASMLGEGAVSDVGGDSTGVSATSAPGDTTVVATQAPISEVNVATSDGQSKVDGTDPLLSTVSNIRLLATCTQAPIGTIQASIPFSVEGMKHCISPPFTPMVKRPRFISMVKRGSLH